MTSSSTSPPLAPRDTRRPRPSVGRPYAALVCCALCCAMLSGCGYVETEYGHRRGPQATASVNGASVLGELFEQAGHDVSSWRYLSPKLDTADVIVWFPDSVAPPDYEAQWWLEDWLSDSPDRTLIYVGRDYEAGILYWERQRSGATAEQLPLIDEQLRDLRWDFKERRTGVLDILEEDSWFSVDDLPEPRYATKLAGDADWLDGINLKQAEIHLSSVLAVDAEYESEVLLADGDEAIVTRNEWLDGGQIIFINNGSFLLNYGLVNHAHRQLATRLIESVGEERRVIFLETGPEGPEILDEDPSLDTPFGLAVLGVWPFNVILLHLAVAGIAFCYYRWPILGLADEPVDEHTSDFGRHVTAVAQWLAASRDVAFARHRLEQYRATLPPEASVPRHVRPLHETSGHETSGQGATPSVAHTDANDPISESDDAWQQPLPTDDSTDKHSRGDSTG